MKTLVMLYESLVYLGSCLKSPLLLICRLYWGWLFMQAGLGKLHDIDKFAELLHSYHLPLVYLNAYLAAFTEFIGGVCLMLGFASRLVAIPLMVVLITAYATVHVESVFNFFHTPAEFVAQSPFNFLLICLFILTFGPGRFSVDYLLEKWVFKTS